MMCLIYFLWIFMCILSVSQCEVYNVKPSVDAYLGQNVTLPCSTSLSTPINWDFESDNDRTICFEGEVVADRNKYSVIHTNPGNYDLIIHNIKYDDKGKYTCIEDGGSGPGRATTLLLVTDSQREVVHVHPSGERDDVDVDQAVDNRQKSHSDDLETSTTRMQNTSPAGITHLQGIGADKPPVVGHRAAVVSENAVADRGSAHLENDVTRTPSSSSADHARLLWITAIMFAGLLLY